MTQSTYDILIIGAGIVGATFAASMAKKGFSIAIFDQHASKEPDIHADPDIQVSAINKATETVFTNLGAWSFMQKLRMCPYRQLEVWEKAQYSPLINHFLGKTSFDTKLTSHSELGYIIENRIIQHGLIKIMKQLRVDMYCPTVIHSMDLFDSLPQVVLKDGRKFRGQLLVGADGKHSRVRQEAQISYSKKNYHQHCLVSTIEIATAHKNKTWQAFTPTGPEAFLPLPCVNGKHFATIIWYHHPATIQDLNALNDSNFLKALQNNFSPELPEIVRIVGRATFSISSLHARQYFKNNVLLIGDAAHAIHPLAGQGVNLGIQDVASLSELLSNSVRQGHPLSYAEILKSYEKSRQPQNSVMMRLMDTFYHTFKHNSLPMILSRNAGLNCTNHLPILRKKITEYAMGTKQEPPQLIKLINKYKSFHLNN